MDLDREAAAVLTDEQIARFRRFGSRRRTRSGDVLFQGTAIGGQAAGSSRIENYVGFPSGIRGDELTNRALVQVHKFGASVSTPCLAVALDTGAGELDVKLGDGSRVAAAVGEGSAAVSSVHTALAAPGHA